MLNILVLNYYCEASISVWMQWISKLVIMGCHYGVPEEMNFTICVFIMRNC